MKKPLSRYAERSLSLAIVCAATLVGILVRLIWLNRASGDYEHFLHPWCEYIQSHGGFAAVGQEFSNYTPPYLYLLVLITRLPISDLYGIKIVSFAFELGLAIMAAMIVNRAHRSSIWSSAAYALVWLAPTVILNGSALAQCDSIYAFFLVLSIYLLMRGRYFWAFLSFAVGLAFKPQAIFLLPLFVAPILKKEISPWYILIIPAGYIAAMMPAVIAGRSLVDLLLFYLEYGGPSHLTLNSPAAFSWFCNLSYSGLFKALVVAGCVVALAIGAAQAKRVSRLMKTLDRPLGISLLIAVVHAFFALTRPFADLILMFSGKASAYQALRALAPWVHRELTPANVVLMAKIGTCIAGIVTCAVVYILSRARGGLLSSPARILHAALLSVLIVPFVMPSMHERYFYAADVISIVFALTLRRYYWVPVIVIMASLLGYVSYIKASHDIPLPYIAMALGLTIITLVTDFLEEPETSK